MRNAITETAILVNTDYVVMAADYELAHRQLFNHDSDPEDSVYEVYVLVKEGQRIDFCDKTCHGKELK